MVHSIVDLRKVTPTMNIKGPGIVQGNSLFLV